MLKILAVDDNQLVLNMYKEFLSNYQLETAIDALSGTSKFSSFAPDLIILDVDMPSGGGGSLFERVRNLFSSSVPILFVTGNPNTIINELKSPKTDLLKKPFTKEQLLSAVNKMLNQK